MVIHSIPIAVNMSIHFHQLKIADIRKETPDCVSIAFEVPESLKKTFDFHHGQNVTLKALVDGEDLRRSYSICSSPNENELRVAVKKADKGKFSTYINKSLKKGDVLEVLPPTGKFYTRLHQSQQKNYLAIAAGSGKRGFVAQVGQFRAREARRQVGDFRGIEIVGVSALAEVPN